MYTAITAQTAILYLRLVSLVIGSSTELREERRTTNQEGNILSRFQQSFSSVPACVPSRHHRHHHLYHLCVAVQGRSQGRVKYKNCMDEEHCWYKKDACAECKYRFNCRDYKINSEDQSTLLMKTYFRVTRKCERDKDFSLRKCIKLLIIRAQHFCKYFSCQSSISANILKKIF
jgi:hypothetical protein